MAGNTAALMGTTPSPGAWGTLLGYGGSPTTGSRTDERANVYGKVIQLSNGLRTITGLPIWCGDYQIPGGAALDTNRLIGTGGTFIGIGALTGAWPNVKVDFAVAFGRRLAPEGERSALSIRRMWANGTLIFATGPNAAVGFLTATANLSNGNTITIDSKVYTLQSTLTNSNGNVKLGATLADTLQNLENAINLGPGAGVAYAAAMTLHSTVSADSDSVHLFVTAKTPGTAGNAIATTETCAAAAWGSATLKDGTASDVRLGSYTHTLHNGSSTQTADSVISADRGTLTPGYRDLIYIVFEDFVPGSITGADPYLLPTITVEFDEATPNSVGDVVRYIALEAGYADGDIEIEAGLFDDELIGVNIADRYDTTTLLKDIGFTFGFDVAETDGKLKVTRTPTAAFTDLTADHLVTSAGFPALTTDIAAPMDQPYSVSVQYINRYSSAWDSYTFTADSELLLTKQAADRQIKLPLIMDPDTVNTLAARGWYKQDAQVVSYAFVLPKSHLALEPMDSVTLTYQNFTHVMQIVSMTINADWTISCEAVAYDFDNNVAAVRLPDDVRALTTAPAVVGATTDYNGPQAAGAFVVPIYTTITIEGWGPGGGSGARGTTGGTVNQGVEATDHTIITLPSTVMVAGKGTKGTYTNTTGSIIGTAGIGGSASGGNVSNLPGSNGGSGQLTGTRGTIGNGGSSPNGGATQITATPSNGLNNAAVAGNAPGGGASSNLLQSGGQFSSGGGGAGGGYSKSTYTIGQIGAPVPGTIIPFTIGSAGTGDPTSTGMAAGADGAQGRVRFTVA